MFWFRYAVYVFDFVEVFGEEIVGILTVWGFRLRGRYKILTIRERGVALLTRFGRRGEECIFSFFQLSHCFCWRFLDGNQVRIRPACSPFVFFSPSAPFSVPPSCTSYTIIIPPLATFVNLFFIKIIVDILDFLCYIIITITTQRANYVKHTRG